MNETILWWQAASVMVAALAATAAAIVAIVLGALDRRSAQRIAAEDRAAALRQARLMTEIDALTRLAAIRTRGGANDEGMRAAAEAAALVSLLGRERVPLNYENWMDGPDPEGVRNDPKTPEWQLHKMEAHEALVALSEQWRAETAVPRGEAAAR